MFSWRSCCLLIVKKYLKSQQEDLGEADNITALSSILGLDVNFVIYSSVV